MARLIKAFWFVTVLATFASLLYVYASIPEMVNILTREDRVDSLVVSRDTLFYVTLALTAFSNFVLYSIYRSLNNRANRKYRYAPTLIKWVLSFGAVLNLFFIVCMQFITLYNSGENFNYDNFGYLIYVTGGFIIIWLISLPISFLFKPKTTA
ncbi:MAG: hypothetical protein AAFX87_14495 [Bacteroidota bacterium]